MQISVKLTAFSFKITWHSTSEAVTVASHKAPVVRNCGQWASTWKDTAPALKSDLCVCACTALSPTKAEIPSLSSLALKAET